MSRISDLAKSFKETSNDEAKSMDRALKSGLKKLESSISTALRESSESLQSAIQDSSEGLEQTIQQRNDRLKESLQASQKEISWSLFKSRFLWPALGGLSLCIGLLGGSWGLANYLGKRVMSLSEEITTMEKSIEALKEQGGNVKLTQCGDSRRLCVKVDPKANGYGAHGEWRILEGY